MPAYYCAEVMTFLDESSEIGAGKMMMVSDLRTSHAREERFGVVCVDVAVDAVRFLMIDPVHREPAVKLVPCAGFIGINLGAPGDPGSDKVKRRDLGSEHAGQRLAVALSDHDHDFTLA